MSNVIGAPFSLESGSKHHIWKDKQALVGSSNRARMKTLDLRPGTDAYHAWATSMIGGGW